MRRGSHHRTRTSGRARRSSQPQTQSWGTGGGRWARRLGSQGSAAGAPGLQGGRQAGRRHHPQPASPHLASGTRPPTGPPCTADAMLYLRPWGAFWIAGPEGNVQPGSQTCHRHPCPSCTAPPPASSCSLHPWPMQAPSPVSEPCDPHHASQTSAPSSSSSRRPAASDQQTP